MTILCHVRPLSVEASASSEPPDAPAAHSVHNESTPADRLGPAGLQGAASIVVATPDEAT
jgi:hypothetical protein